MWLLVAKVHVLQCLTVFLWTQIAMGTGPWS